MKQKFYEKWAKNHKDDPQRENILKWKAINLANLFLRTLNNQTIKLLCEIGGAEGTVLDTINQTLKAKKVINYELSKEFCITGKKKYPNINFVNKEFSNQSQNYDIIILSDIIEHIENESEFLKLVANHCQYALIKIPIEICLLSKNKYGKNHPNGHLRGYTISSTIRKVSQFFNILDYEISDSLFFYGTRKQKLFRKIFGKRIAMFLWGGNIFILAKSKLIENPIK